MKKSLVFVFKLILAFIILAVLYVGITMLLGTINDFKPEEVIELEVEGKAAENVVSDTFLTFANWNVGYGGLGAESNFFYDAGGFLTDKGKMVRAKKEWVNKNIDGALDFIKNNQADFYLFQEVDRNSKRSYHINQYDKYLGILPGYASTYSVNYKVGRVPLPILQPWKVMGKMDSGLGTYTRFSPNQSTRFQFPGSYSWPTRIFQLDRCMAVHRFQTAFGKELIVINTHNSAYDDGSMKKQQMEYMKNLLIEEYEKGNYVVVGGDWNQCPPYFKYDTFSKGAGGKGYSQLNIDPEFLPADWIWAYDPVVPTNRKLTDTYVKEESFQTLIDYYLVSPNVEVVSVKGVDQDFQFSDHQPVMLKVRLKTE
ncbi:MAG: endonuclease/exonuclease/phosphatase family protein [Bacteroidota bacterium]